MKRKKIYVVKQMRLCQHTCLSCYIAGAENNVDRSNFLEL